MQYVYTVTFLVKTSTTQKRFCPSIVAVSILTQDTAEVFYNLASLSNGKNIIRFESLGIKSAIVNVKMRSACLPTLNPRPD
jgi:hypothetical protein